MQRRALPHYMQIRCCLEFDIFITTVVCYNSKVMGFCLTQDQSRGQLKVNTDLKITDVIQIYCKVISRM